MPKKENLAPALLVIRLGLGCYFGLLAIDKIAWPQHGVEMFSSLYFLNLSASLVMLLGALELVLALFIILGIAKTVSYGLGTLLQGASIALAYHQLPLIFGTDQLTIEAIPILFSLIALFLMRDLDTMFSFSKKRSMFS